jgi:hypothetical protein
MERVEQKDQKVVKNEEGPGPVTGALIEVHRALGPVLSDRRTRRASVTSCAFAA